MMGLRVTFRKLALRLSSVDYLQLLAHNCLFHSQTSGGSWDQNLDFLNPRLPYIQTATAATYLETKQIITFCQPRNDKGRVKS